MKKKIEEKKFDEENWKKLKTFCSEKIKFWKNKNLKTFCSEKIKFLKNKIFKKSSFIKNAIL